MSSVTDSDISSPASIETAQKQRSWTIFIQGLIRAPLDLPRALAHSGPYFVYGLLIGWALLQLEEAVRPQHQSMAELAHHLALGFFVSSVAVLLYEWGAHFKELLTSSNELSKTIRIHVRRVMDASAKDAVKRGVQDLLDVRSDVLASETDRLLEAVVHIYERAGWCRHAYLSFIATMLNNLRHNAESLVKLSKELAQDPEADADFKLRLPDPGHLADVVLSKVTEALDDAGQYLAVSDIDSWLKIPEFVKKQRAGVARGVRIRRIFVVPTPPPWHATRVLLDHYGYIKDWSSPTTPVERGGSYAIRVIRQEHFAKSPLAQMRHFGVFLPSGMGDSAVMFEVTSTDLSSFKLRGIEQNFLVDFEQLWAAEAERTPEQRVDLLMTLQMECAELSTYHALSDFNSWRGDKLKSFRETTRDAYTRGVSVRRVFVYRTEIDKAVCRDIFRDHYEEANDTVVNGRKPYEINICTIDEAKARMGEAWHFGVFRSSDHEGLKVMLSELPNDDFTDFGMAHVATQTRARSMDVFVESLPPVRERAQQLLDLKLP